jgi:hypothetical protein
MIYLDPPLTPLEKRFAVACAIIGLIAGYVFGMAVLP